MAAIIINPQTNKLAPIMAAKTPTPVRNRARTIFRSVIRQPNESRRHSQVKRSNRIAPPLLGGLGPIASAGSNRKAARAPCQVPNTEHRRLMPMPTTYTPGYISWGRLGNSKYWR